MHEQTLVQIYRDTVHGLYRFVSTRCGGNRSLAEDVTQEAWLRAVVDWRKKGLPDEPLAWLVTVARNLLSNYFRRNQPIPIEQAPRGWDIETLDDGFDPDDPEIATLLSWGLARLRKDQAEMLEAFYFERRKVADIAVSNGLSERAVEGRLRRARLSLRKILKPALKQIGEKL